MKDVTKLGNIADIYDGPHATPKKIENGKYFLSISSLDNGSLDLSKSAFISDKDFIKWTKRVQPQKGDLLFSYETRLGEAALMPDNLQACLGRRMGLLRPKKDKVIPQYLLFAYLSPEFQKVIRKNTIKGATVDRIALNELGNFPIYIPDLKTQQSIAAVLSALDKKIALNKQINARLEEMAKTLYDYWFVQFDFPDANGKPYKSSGGKMVFDETLKREIPKGWEVKSLGEIADLYQPATLSEKELNKNGQFLVYGANGIIGKYNKFNHENPVVAVACRGNSCGAINITQPKSWITGNAMVVNPKNKNMCIDFIKNTLLVNNLDKVVSGSAQPQITRTNFAPLKVITPNESLLKLYSDIINPMFNKRINRIQQNAKLTQLRDFLLPMLMNGQVSVAE
jgi:restriction modification system DNA specificity domain protein